MTIINAFNVNKLDQDYLYELKKGGITTAHLSIGIWESARETLSEIRKNHVFNGGA